MGKKPDVKRTSIFLSDVGCLLDWFIDRLLCNATFRLGVIVYWEALGLYMMLVRYHSNNAIYFTDGRDKLALFLFISTINGAR